jgi:hypothetical protein
MQLQEKQMNKLAVALIVVSSALSGCVAYEVQDRDGGARHAERNRDGGYDRDRDRDGVPNRQDRRPDDPRRY